MRSAGPRASGSNPGNPWRRFVRRMTEAGGLSPTGLGSVGSLPLPVDDPRGLIGGRERGPANRILALGLVGQLVAGLDDLWRLLEGQRLWLAPERRIKDLVH